jgi:hypothetical protein
MLGAFMNKIGPLPKQVMLCRFATLQGSAVKLMILLLLVGSMAAQLPSKPKSSDAYTDPDGYLVYSLVIKHITTYEFQSDVKIVVNDHTVTYQRMCSTPNKKYQAMLASAIADYAKVNSVRRRLLPQFEIEKPYELLGDGATSGGHWIELSSIGFSRDKTLAVLTAGTSSISDYVLIKRNGKWQFLEGWSDQGCAWAS